MILRLLVYLTFFLFSLGQFGRISYFGQQINVYWYEIVLAIFSATLMLKYRLTPLKLIYLQNREIFLFFIWLLISFVAGINSYSGFENAVGFLYLSRLLLNLLFGVYTLYWIGKEDFNFKSFKKSISLLVVLTIIFSAVQYLFYPDLRNLIYAGWDPHLYRLFGTFFDTSVAGAIYGLLFIFIYLAQEKFLDNKYLRIACLAVFIIFIALTFSRNLYLSFLITAFIHIFRKKKFREFFLISALFLITLFFSPKTFGEGVNLSRLFSIQSRADDYKNAVKIWQKKPFLGIGYNRIRYEKIRMNIIEGFNSDITHSGASFHSSYLIILVTAGLIGLVLFLIAFMKIGLTSEFSKNGIIFLGLMSLSDNIILHSYVIFVFISLALLFSFSHVHKRR